MTALPAVMPTSASRSSLRRLAEAGLPGLVHFGGLNPLVLRIGVEISELELSLNENEFLNLDGVRLVPDPAMSDIRITSEMSSQQGGEIGAALLLLKGQPIHTKRQDRPWWRLRLDKPAFVDRIEIVNRAGIWGSRSHGLLAEWQLPNGLREGFDSLSLPVLLVRLQGLRSALTAAEAAYLTANKNHEIACAFVTGFGRTYAAHLDMVEMSLTAPRQTDMAALEAGREELLVQISGGLGQFFGEELVSFRLLAPLLDALVWKGPVAKGQSRPYETEIVGLLLTLEFLARGAVELPRTLEFQGFILDAAAIATTEKALSKFATRAGVPTATRPILLRPHGFRGSELRHDETEFVSAIFDIAGLLRELGYEAGICYGTLLGAVREGRLIEHDDDVDMIIAVSETDPRGELVGIVANLVRRKVDARVEKDHDLLKIRSPASGKFVDVFPVIRRPSGRCILYMEQMAMREIDGALIFPMRPLAFYGRNVLAPSEPERFLEERYGPTWRVPNRFYGMHWLEPS